MPKEREAQQFINQTMLAAALLMAGACSASNEADVGSTQQALPGEETFIYLRCNATGWALDESTRLEPGAEPGIFTLTFAVEASWMTVGGDQCSIVETNQSDGWGTWQRAFTKADSSSLEVPGSGPIEPGWSYFDVVYPALGEYTATLDWAAATLEIEASGSAEPWVLEWPLPGEPGTDWVINSYVDLDPSSAIADYQGGSRTYNGHRGVDWDVSTFREMDADVPVLAAVAGEVVAFEESNPDRNTECMGDWNYVTVLTDNDYEITYGHLKQNSITVSFGQRVEAGDTLGVVGSSGCSTQPHVHLEILDSNGSVVDPFLQGLWRDPPPYETPLTIMDIVVADQHLSSIDDVIDPVDDVSLFQWGDPIGVGLSVAGATPGDVIEVSVLRPDATVYYNAEAVVSNDFPHSFWYWNFSFNALQGPEGVYTIEVRANAELQRSYELEVEAP